jgi:hypothetical protein
VRAALISLGSSAIFNFIAAVRETYANVVTSIPSVALNLNLSYRDCSNHG